MSSFGSLVSFVKNQKLIQNKESAQDHNDANHFFDEEKIKFSTKIEMETSLGDKVVVKEKRKFVLKHFMVSEQKVFANNFNKDNFDRDSIRVTARAIPAGVESNTNFPIKSIKREFPFGSNSIVVEDLEGKKNKSQCFLTKKLNFIGNQECGGSKKNIITYLSGLSEGDIGQDLQKSNITIFTSSGSCSPVSSFLIQMKDGKITKEKCSYARC